MHGHTQSLFIYPNFEVTWVPVFLFSASTFSISEYEGSHFRSLITTGGHGQAGSRGGSKGTRVPSGPREPVPHNQSAKPRRALSLSVCGPSNLCPFVCLEHYQSQVLSGFLAATQHILFLIICHQVNRRQEESPSPAHSSSTSANPQIPEKGSGPWKCGAALGRRTCQAQRWGSLSPPSQAPLGCEPGSFLPAQPGPGRELLSLECLCLPQFTHPKPPGGLQTRALGWGSGDSWGVAG